MARRAQPTKEEKAQINELLSAFKDKRVLSAPRVSIRKTGKEGKEREEVITTGEGLRAGPYNFNKYGYFLKTEKKSCSWGFDRPFPTGRTELEMVSPGRAKELGVKPGVVLRLCFGEDQPGAMIPVKTPQEALKNATKFRDCVVGGEEAQKCAIGTAGEPLRLGAMKTRRRTPRRGRR